MRTRNNKTMMRIAALIASLGIVSGQQCTLCVDGSEPNLALSSERTDMSCSQLAAEASDLALDNEECQVVQVYGYQDCGCPEPPGFCFLCPDGSSDIPNLDEPVPSTQNNVTCGDILFIPESVLDGECSRLDAFQELCSCPESSGEPCSFCENGETPAFQERRIPYLDNDVTCGAHAIATQRASEPSCSVYTDAPVPVDGQSFCGCPGTSTYDLCTMCPGGAIVNPYVVVPNTGGLTCQELSDYIRYVTDVDSCEAIAASANVCCQELPTCIICPDGTNNVDESVVYPPYDLTCEYIGNANEFGFPMTCSDVQERFPFYCGCEGVSPSCSICGNGEQPPSSFLGRAIPLLEETCGGMNAFASLRTDEECGEVTNLPVNVAAYCGCRDAFPRNVCELCPEGTSVRNDVDYAPPGAGSANCRELADFATYVTNSLMCSEVQQFARDCCFEPGETFPTLVPTELSSSSILCHLEIYSLVISFGIIAISLIT